MFNFFKKQGSLTYNELELLYMIRKSSLCDWHRKSFTNADAMLAKFFKMGYLREANAEELFSTQYKVPELKKLAANIGIKTTGLKKADLINALISNLSQEELVGLLDKNKELHFLTDKGRKALDKHKKSKEAEENSIFDSLVEIFLSGKFGLLSRFEQDGFSLGGGTIASDEAIAKDIFNNSCNDLCIGKKAVIDSRQL